MKKILLFIFAAATFAACSDDDSVAPNITPSQKGTFTDPRDGIEYGWVRFGSLDWMNSNMKADADEGSYSIYSTDTKFGVDDILHLHWEEYGYIYNHKAAMAACPAGWRLPSDDDWKALEKALGMSGSEANRTDWRGSFAGELMQQSASGTELNMYPTGYQTSSTTSYTSDDRLFGIYGFFWTSTSDDVNSNYSYYRKLCYNSGKVFRYTTMNENRLAVRCVRDAQ